MVIIGYKIPTTDMTEVESEIKKVQEKVKNIAEKSYHKLLSKEIEFLCDNIAMNIIPRPEGVTIFDTAVAELTREMNTAAITSAPTEYNHSLYAHLMIYEGNTYLKVLSPNKALLKAFKSMEDVSLSNEECMDEKNAKTILWQKLHKLYEKNEPISINLTATTVPNEDKVSFGEVQDRANVLARYHVSNCLLNQLSGGEQIPPCLLMRRIDEMLDILITDEYQLEIDKKARELTHVLPDLKADSAFIFGEKECECEADETEEK